MSAVSNDGTESEADEARPVLRERNTKRVAFADAFESNESAVDEAKGSEFEPATDDEDDEPEIVLRPPRQRIIYPKRRKTQKKRKPYDTLVKELKAAQRRVSQLEAMVSRLQKSTKFVKYSKKRAPRPRPPRRKRPGNSSDTEESDYRPSHAKRYANGVSDNDDSDFDLPLVKRLRTDRHKYLGEDDPMEDASATPVKACSVVLEKYEPSHDELKGVDHLLGEMIVPDEEPLAGITPRVEDPSTSSDSEDSGTEVQDPLNKSGSTKDDGDHEVFEDAVEENE